MNLPISAVKSGPLKGSMRVAGDKSISHRALILGALAIEETSIYGLLKAEDILATARALRALGVPVRQDGEDWRVTGRGIGGLTQPGGPIDFGNSGTGIRLMMGVIAGHAMSVTATGDHSLSSRPMDRVLRPLQLMGLDVTEKPGKTADRLPLTLNGTRDLIPIEYELPVASAQVKSAILLAGLHAPGETTVIEPVATRDHTERMLAYFGAAITTQAHANGRAITVCGHGLLKGQAINIPADPSSAAFLAGAAVIVPGSDITLPDVLINKTRIGFYRTLIEMGADISFSDEREEAGEPVATIKVRAGRLRGITVPAECAPSMIDEYPCLAVLAAFGEGETCLKGLGELRVKESDRLSATAAGLEKAGVSARIEGDDLIVTGRQTVPGGCRIATHLDHRIAMSFLTLGLASEKPVEIDDVSMIATSFPTYLDLMGKMGARFEQQGGAAT